MVFRRPYTTRVRGERPDDHVATLRRRYGEKRLREAAARRAHLNYQRISIGRGTGSGRVKSLLAQMHQNYYFGFAESACILAGTVLEQGLTAALGEVLDSRGPLSLAKGAERRWLQTRDDLLDLDLVAMLDLARAEGVIADGRSLLLAHQVRWIRNMVVHERIPLFRAGDAERLELRVLKNRRGRAQEALVTLPRAEVAGLAGALPAPSAEITAYFCVSRTRMILAGLFENERVEARNDDESGGGLLLWPEP
jgi:hypothetical protein